MNHFYTDFTSTVKADREVTCNINIQDFQVAANVNGYRDQDGNKLVEDGIDGPKTQYVRKKIALKANPLGASYSVGSKGALVSLHQRRCNEILGVSIAVDGKFGKDTRESYYAVARKTFSCSGRNCRV